MSLTLRNVVIAVLTISFVTFVVLFGRVPALRYTPIGYLYRLLWVHLPHFLRRSDQRLTGGRLTAWALRGGHYLTEEKHPVVLVIFISLLFFSECAFLPTAYSHLSTTQVVALVPIIILPYRFIYLSWTATSHLINPSNHAAHMIHYPYDHVLFHPGNICRTCKLLKPARSKHCSICKTCVSKHDHHCIWINNCLGRGNYQYFILMLFSTGILLSYGAYLAYSILSNILQTTISPPLPGQHWSAGKTWTDYSQLWAWVIVQHVRIGFVGLLALMCSPLAWGLLGYHTYLIWAGMTTNESVKWSELREDIFEGLVFMGEKGKGLQSDYNDGIAASVTASRETLVQPGDDESEREREAEREPMVPWPVSTNQVVVRTEDGERPSRQSGTEDGVGGWRRVRSLQEIENIYDLGFWDNLLDIFETG